MPWVKGLMALVSPHIAFCIAQKDLCHLCPFHNLWLYCIYLYYKDLRGVICICTHESLYCYSNTILYFGLAKILNLWDLTHLIDALQNLNKHLEFYAGIPTLVVISGDRWSCANLPTNAAQICRQMPRKSADKCRVLGTFEQTLLHDKKMLGFLW